MGEHAAAESTLRRAQALVDETVYDPTFGTVHLILGHLERHRGRPIEASNHYRVAVERFVAAEDPAGHADALVGLARCSALEGEHEAATQRFEEILSMTDENGDSVARACALRGLSEIERTLGSPDRAESNVESLRELGQQHDNPQWIRHAELEQARIHHGRGDLSGADARYTRVLEQANRLNLRSEAARVTLDLARLDLDRGQLGRAHTRALAALAFFEQNSLDLDLARALAVLGVCDHLAGQSDTARDIFDRQLSLSDALANAPALADALWLSASQAFDTGADALAESHLERLESLDTATPLSALHLAALRARSAVRSGSGEGISRAARALEDCQQVVGEFISPLDSPAAALREIAERDEHSAEGRVT
jgi:tetratricopeptide (TPR) repeat protein